MERLYVARNMAKFPLTKGVRLQEVSVSGGSTVFERATAHFPSNTRQIGLNFWRMNITTFLLRTQLDIYFFASFFSFFFIS